MPIRRLSQSLINKIAAGEVIERPASVVKELMENALDAGATRIDVGVRQGGLEMIRVVDNGGGIAADELPLAVASHATSKIAEADDLFRVRSLGFRGEALASIAEVSRLAIRSRVPACESGAELEVVGGQVSAVSPCGAPPGTLVEVSNLFYNTPVRRKFLRTTQTELGHVSEVFTRIALAAPEVHFSLRHNDKPVFELPAAAALFDRVAGLFGRELADQLLAVESVDGEVRLGGYVAHPSHSRSHNRMQYLLLNRRFIRDRALQHALGEAYRGLLMVGRFPIAFLNVEMPPELVDVNVHPTKLEVRFQDSGRLYSQLLATLRTRFLTTDLTTRGTAPPGTAPSITVSPVGLEGTAGDPARSGPQDDRPYDERRAAELRQQLVDWAQGEVAAGSRGASESDPAAGPFPIDERDPGADGPMWSAPPGNPSHAPLRLTTLPEHMVRGVPQPPAGDSLRADLAHEHEPHRGPAAPFPSVHAAAAAADSPLARSRSALQIHNRYLVTESAAGVAIIDQHALHERILYEQLRRRVEAGPVETQQLLVPEPVDLRPAEAAAAIEARELLARLGLRIEAFGGDTVLVVGFPAMLANLSPAEVLRELIDKLLTGGKTPDRRDLLDELLHTIACKAAVKAGDRLTPEEIETLLEQRHLVDDAHHCPHGRPTELVFTREELDRQFRRV